MASVASDRHSRLRESLWRATPCRRELLIAGSDALLIIELVHRIRNNPSLNAGQSAPNVSIMNAQPIGLRRPPGCGGARVLRSVTPTDWRGRTQEKSEVSA
jgi:hypothetical protein